jgi:phospholipid/cholesterol/gamma-HCH transport system permease protein
MSEALDHLREDTVPGPARRLLRGVGGLVIRPLVGAWVLGGLAMAVLLQGLRPGSWRRTVRTEFVRHMGEMGIAALPAVTGVAALVGLGLVLQALYWLRLFGQAEVVGNLLVLILVRELAPLVVATLLVGRSATAVMSELHELARGGGLRALDAMGVDPFHYLVLPRVAAMSLACFCLNVIFVATALLIGYLGASLAGLARVSLPHFLAEVLAKMGIGEFVISIAKPLLFGVLVALVACAVALRPAAAEVSLRELLPQGFTAAMALVLMASATLSALL